MRNFRVNTLVAVFALSALAACKASAPNKEPEPPSRPQADSCAMDHAIDVGVEDPRVDPHGATAIQIVDVQFDREIRSQSIPESKRKNLKLELFQVKANEAWSGFLGAAISNLPQGGGDWIYTAGFSYAYDKSNVDLKGSVATEGEQTMYRTTEIPLQDVGVKAAVAPRTNSVVAGFQGTKLLSLAITLPVYKLSDGASPYLVYTGENETLCLKSGRLAPR